MTEGAEGTCSSPATATTPLRAAPTSPLRAPATRAIATSAAHSCASSRSRGPRQHEPASRSADDQPAGPGRGRLMRVHAASDSDAPVTEGAGASPLPLLSGALKDRALHLAGVLTE